MDSIIEYEPAESLTVGREFIEWAEKYWHLDKIVKINDPDHYDGEICNYEYMRDIFIQKIDTIISNRLK